jgi:hypothetical protein
LIQLACEEKWSLGHYSKSKLLGWNLKSCGFQVLRQLIDGARPTE